MSLARLNMINSLFRRNLKRQFYWIVCWFSALRKQCFIYLVLQSILLSLVLKHFQPSLWIFLQTRFKAQCRLVVMSMFNCVDWFSVCSCLALAEIRNNRVVMAHWSFRRVGVGNMSTWWELYGDHYSFCVYFLQFSSCSWTYIQLLIFASVTLSQIY